MNFAQLLAALRSVRDTGRALTPDDSITLALEGLAHWIDADHGLFLTPYRMLALAALEETANLEHLDEYRMDAAADRDSDPRPTNPDQE